MRLAGATLSNVELSLSPNVASAGQTRATLTEPSSIRA